jgi:hypothetical protein
MFPMTSRASRLIKSKSIEPLHHLLSLGTNTSINISIQSERLFAGQQEDETNIVNELTDVYNQNYKSVNFGEEILKEMIMSSVFGVPVSAKTAMSAYQLMLKRVTIVATRFTEFSNLPFSVQQCLLQHNADMVVSLRGAQFFQLKQQGKDQILCSLGAGDVEIAKTMIAEVQKTHNTIEKDYKAIEYRKFNTIQNKVDNSSDEERYDLLLSRVGDNVAFDENILTLFSYVILFCTDFIDDAINTTTQKMINEAQSLLITLLQKYVYLTYPKPNATIVFKRVLECIQDLRELCYIKQRRRIIAIRKVKFTESFTDVEPTANNI